LGKENAFEIHGAGKGGDATGDDGEPCFASGSLATSRAFYLPRRTVFVRRMLRDARDLASKRMTAQEAERLGGSNA
jgi:hypothetical protein